MLNPTRVNISNQEMLLRQRSTEFSSQGTILRGTSSLASLVTEAPSNSMNTGKFKETGTVYIKRYMYMSSNDQTMFQASEFIVSGRLSQYV